MPYIHFTEEQKLRAASVDLAEFLRRQGEKLIRSGPEYRLASDHSITIQGNEWYDHAVKEGGGPISFVQQFYNLSYPEAVTCLLDGEQGAVYVPAPKRAEKPKREFVLPNANQNMRRVYAYLLNRRFLDRNVVNAFVRAGLLYESCEKFKDREYHNAVFVGRDENGVPRHAHKRSLNSFGKTFRINVEGSDPRCSFHHTGSSNRLYVFEAPIDLMSFLSWSRTRAFVLSASAWIMTRRVLRPAEGWRSSSTNMVMMTWGCSSPSTRTGTRTSRPGKDFPLRKRRSILSSLLLQRSAPESASTWRSVSSRIGWGGS